MSPHEVINGFVPRAPIRSDTGTVPPLAIELSIAKSHDLRERVAERLENCKETCQPDDE